MIRSLAVFSSLIALSLVSCKSQPEAPANEPPVSAAPSAAPETSNDPPSAAPEGGDEASKAAGPSTQPAKGLDPSGAAEVPPSSGSQDLDPMAAPGGYSEAEFAKLHALKTGENIQTAGMMIDIKGSKAYLSLPEGKSAPMPAVLIIHEWWGLNDNIKLWADRMAKEGYAALAVDLYNGQVATTPDEAGKMMKSVDAKRAKTILKNAYAFLGKDKRIKAKKRAVIGWCFGGGWSLYVALSEPTLTASVIYYGELVNDPKKLKNIKASLLGIFANKDKWITPEIVSEFKTALGKTKVDHKILSYDADHAFGNPSNKERYDGVAAEAAWKEVEAFLKHHLGN